MGQAQSRDIALKCPAKPDSTREKNSLMTPRSHGSSRSIRTDSSFGRIGASTGFRTVFAAHLPEGQGVHKTIAPHWMGGGDGRSIFALRAENQTWAAMRARRSL